MPEWDADLRTRLAGLQLTPAREAEIIEELSQHLDDRYEELRASSLRCASNEEAARIHSHRSTHARARHRRQHET
jgi:hypothetical protein